MPGTGYRGRVAPELMVVDEDLQDDICRDAGHQVRERLRDSGHIMLVQDGLHHLRAGNTSVEDHVGLALPGHRSRADP